MLRAMMCVLVVGALAGCSSITQGTGHVHSPVSSSHSPDFPSGQPTATFSPQPSTTSATSSSPTPTASASAPTRKEREDRLTAQTNGEAHVLVAVPGGFEAATYDRVGGIQFWRSVGRSVDWTQTGASAYPAEVGGRPYTVTVVGARLSRMQHATFIVTGQFTQDGSGLAVAYTTGAKGWGAIKAEPNGNIGPSGRPVGADRIGLSRGFAFVAGKLQTQDCPLNQPIANCDSNPVTKLWSWTGTDFARA